MFSGNIFPLVSFRGMFSGNIFPLLSSQRIDQRKYIFAAIVSADSSLEICFHWRRSAERPAEIYFQHCWFRGFFTGNIFPVSLFLQILHWKYISPGVVPRKYVSTGVVPRNVQRKYISSITVSAEHSAEIYFHWRRSADGSAEIYFHRNPFHRFSNRNVSLLASLL